MGFPVGYSELPRLFLHVIFLMGHVRRLISWTFDFVGLGDLLDDSDAPWPDPPADGRQDHQHRRPELRPVPAAALIDEALPVVRFEALGRVLPESCAVCLHELEGREEVRRLGNCRHVFHRWCLDRWIGHGHRTCPLCRAPLFPEAAPAAPDWLYDDEYYPFHSPPPTPMPLPW